MKLIILVRQIIFLLENKEVYEGEVTEISPVETENPAGGFTKTVSHVVLGLKSAKGMGFFFKRGKATTTRETFYFADFQSNKIVMHFETFYYKMQKRNTFGL